MVLVEACVVLCCVVLRALNKAALGRVHRLERLHALQ
jgi:hypothetical protein